MIIWSGLGVVVVAIVFLTSLAANLLTNAITHDPTYYDTHEWPLAVSLLVSAAITWAYGAYLQSKPGRIVIDKETGQETQLKRDHRLFFIPMKWWGPILALIGIWLGARDLLK